ncbi:MAG TPA: sugar-binding protein [Polyangiaceae bacterium]|nr:sugar-binding protein [Polyangiaceae bacterium]
MAYSVRGHVWVGLACALLGSSAAGACGSSNGGKLPGSGGESAGGADEGTTAQMEECRSDKDCRSTDQLCGDANVCVDCIVDSHCGAGEVCTEAGHCKKIGLNSTDGGAPSDGGTKNGGGTNTGGTSTGGTSNGGTNAGGTSNGQAGTVNGEGGAATNNLDCVTAPLDPCAGIPHFVGIQTVDGDSTDFCDIAPFTLELASSPYYRSPKAPLASTTRATFRVAWSAAALHVFVSVQDSTAHPNQSGSLLNVWNGDNIEFYASPKVPTGLFNASRTYDYGAFQVIAAAPGVTTPAGKAAFTSTGVAYAVPEAQYKVSPTAQGYTVEAQIPWTDATPIAGTKMGFDAGLSDDIDGLYNINSEYRDYYALTFNASYHGNCTTYYEPYCDSHNWCTPTALP